MDQFKTTSERIDDLPLLIYWLKRMQVDVIIDQVLGPPHGNWAGLSYGEVALVFMAYVLMCCTHFLSPMQEWASKHLLSLSQALGIPVSLTICAVVLATALPLLIRTIRIDRHGEVATRTPAADEVAGAE